jgi:hypothetical protein
MKASARLVLATALAAGCSPSRDIVPETHDVRVATQPDSGTAGYAYVAKRLHGTLALNGTKSLADEDAHRLLDKLADDFEACAARLEADGSLVEGAARFVVAAGPHGTGEVSEMQLAPGGPVAANALLCLVAPARASSFAGGGGGAVPAILVDAAWNPVRAGKP